MYINSKELLPAVLYGLAWSVAAAGHQFIAFLLLAMVGLFLGVIFGIKGWMENMFRAIAIWAGLIILGIFIPFFGEIADSVFLLVALILKMKVIAKNFLAMVVGFVLYIGLFFWPPSFHVNAIVDIIIGTAIMIGVCYVLEQMGYTKKNVFKSTVGLPGFLVMLFGNTMDGSTDA